MYKGPVQLIGSLTVFRGSRAAWYSGREISLRRYLKSDRSLPRSFLGCQRSLQSVFESILSSLQL